MREWLRAMRISHGMTAEDMAQALGTDVRRYMKTEAGECRSLDFLFALRLAGLFGISLDLIAQMDGYGKGGGTV